MSSTPKLFTPLPLGTAATSTGITLQHRVALAPLGRLRPDIAHDPTDLLVEYYSQRGSTPGTLLVSESTYIDARAGGYDHSPGIWNEEQIRAWEKVTNAVHKRGSYIFLQLWALGRSAHPGILAREPGGPFPHVAPSALRLPGREREPAPRALRTQEIEEYVQLYANAAENAMRAGFDGVELQGANGYLVDQFLQDVSNHRTDAYGGSVPARAKFALDVVAAITSRIGAARTAIRLSPWSTFQGMRMADPLPTFTYLVSQLREKHPDLAYVHLIEPALVDSVGRKEGESNGPLRTIWRDGREGAVIISAGEFSPELALTHAEATGDVVAFGLWFIANPDLPRRIRESLPLNAYDVSTFYTVQSPVGYIDYPFYDEVLARMAEEKAKQSEPEPAAKAKAALTAISVSA